MAARPAKRQRRSTVILSDDEDDVHETSDLALRAQGRDTKSNTHNRTTSFARALRAHDRPSNPTTRTSSAKSSPTTSPQKSRKTSKQALEAHNNKSLHSFFNRASEEQRWQRRVDTPQQESQEDSIADDIIDDDLSDEELLHMVQEQSTQKPLSQVSKSTTGSRISCLRSAAPSSSQKFAKIATRSVSTDPPVQEQSEPLVQEHKTWADRYGPTTIDELAIHKKKVADVQKWLEDVLTGRSPQGILVLKGPAGSGKSTAISLLAQVLGVNIVSWNNSAVSESGTVSNMHQFADFLDRGAQFEALSFGSSSLHDSKQPERQLLMVEEYPTTMSRSSAVLDSFRSILHQHILRSSKMAQFGGRQASTGTQQPLVLIISETLLSSSTALADSFTAHRLLGPEILNHPLVSVIEFNPVAPTFILKAIDVVVKKEAKDSKRRRTPGPAVLQQLAEVGDIRSAINSLEFLCARGDDNAQWSGTVAARSKKTAKGSVALTEVEQNALQLISQRESTLDMFHAAGKIVYNKREDPRVLDSRAEPPPKPPDHLMHLYSPKVSQVNVESLLNETGTDIQTFISTLHENYVLSCNGDNFVDSFASCAEFLSSSDYLNPESRSLIRSKGVTRTSTSTFQSGNYDMLRQDEISFQVASRGLLFSLPFPVNRAVVAGSRKQDAFKMFYPASLRLWKPAEEIHDLVSLFANSLKADSLINPANDKQMSGVASWKARSTDFGVTISQDNKTDDQICSTSFMSKENLITELLPYLTMIRASRSVNIQVLKKITQLRGINISGDEILDEEQYDVDPRPALGSVRLQQRVEEAHSILQAQKVQASRKSLTAGSKSVDLTEPEEKLYISDDDIQDD